MKKVERKIDDKVSDLHYKQKKKTLDDKMRGNIKKQEDIDFKKLKMNNGRKKQIEIPHVSMDEKKIRDEI